MDAFITITISLMLILGAAVTMGQTGYTFDLRRRPRHKIIGGRRHDDLAPVRVQP
jgi:hypothetical protein